MRTLLVVFSAVMVFGGFSTVARSQNQMIDFFGQIMRTAIVENARSEWDRLGKSERQCLETRMLAEGNSVAALIKQGIPPSAPQFYNLKQQCRTPVVQNAEPNLGVVSRGMPEQAPSPIYIVDGLALGGRVNPDSQAYREYRCDTSEQFAGFTWCHKRKVERKPQGEILSTNSLVISASGQAFYINRYISPAVIGANSSDSEIQRLSNRFQERPKIERMAQHDTFLGAVIASWGGVRLEPLTQDEKSILAAGKNLNKGILVDFLGDFLRSAREGLAVYRLVGTGGYVWSANYGRSGTGSLRFLAIDASAISPPGSAAPPEKAIPTAAAPVPPESAPADTPKIKEAREYLDDAKTFIRTQNDVPRLKEIAFEAAALQIAVDNFNEPSAVKSLSKLKEILDPSDDFSKYRRGVLSDRAEKEKQRVATEVVQARKSVHFINGYIRANLGAKSTTDLLNYRARFERSISRSSLSDLEESNRDFLAFIEGARLSQDYTELTRDFLKPETGKSEAGPLADRIPAQARVLVEGNTNDVVVLYNSSNSAPNIGKDLKGSYTFEGGRVSFCPMFAQLDPILLRILERKFAEAGGRTPQLSKSTCDLSKVASEADLIVVERARFLRGSEEQVMSLAGLMASDSFRAYEVIPSSYLQSIRQDRQAEGLSYEAELEKEGRAGYGVLVLPDPNGVACVVQGVNAEDTDGLKLLVARDRKWISPSFENEWRFVTVSEEGAFLSLQRRQCQYGVGDGSALRNILLGLRREKKPFSLASVWYSAEQLRQASFEARSAIEEQKIRDADKIRAIREQAAIKKARDQHNQQEQGQIELVLRNQNGPKAKGLLDEIDGAAKGILNDSRRARTALYTNLGEWSLARAKDQWETFEVKSEVQDFGSVTLKGRPLDGIIAKIIVQQKNRIKGEYSKDCFFVAQVDDPEFQMNREIIDFPCTDSRSGADWQSRLAFKSKWNARTVPLGSGG